MDEPPVFLPPQPGQSYRPFDPVEPDRPRPPAMTVPKAIVTLVVLVILLVVGSRHSGNATSASASPTPSWFDRLQEDSYRRAFAELAMKQAYLRDPDSLVIESTSACSHSTGSTDWLVFAVHYRAKNGFGGYNQSVAWFLVNPYNGEYRILTEAQYDEFLYRDTARTTPAPSHKKHRQHP